MIYFYISEPTDFTLPPFLMPNCQINSKTQHYIVYFSDMSLFIIGYHKATVITVCFWTDPELLTFWSLYIVHVYIQFIDECVREVTLNPTVSGLNLMKGKYIYFGSTA